jgi:hypothetical protein
MAAGAARELDHGLIAVEEGEARELAPVAVAFEEAYGQPLRYVNDIKTECMTEL